MPYLHDRSADHTALDACGVGGGGRGRQGGTTYRDYADVARMFLFRFPGFPGRATSYSLSLGFSQGGHILDTAATHEQLENVF